MNKLLREGSLKISEGYVISTVRMRDPYDEYERLGENEIEIRIKPASMPLEITAGSEEFKAKFPNEGDFLEGRVITPETFGIVEQPTIGKCFKVEVSKIMENQERFIDKPSIVESIDKAKKNIIYGKEFYFLFLDLNYRNRKNGNIEISGIYHNQEELENSRVEIEEADLKIEDKLIDISSKKGYMDIDIVRNLIEAQMLLNGNKKYDKSLTFNRMYIWDDWETDGTVFVFCDSKKAKPVVDGVITNLVCERTRKFY